MSSAHEDLDATAEDVWRRYDILEEGPLSPLDAAGGFSGARLWRGQTGTGDWLLRGWPASMNAGRLSMIHGLQRQARLAGLGFVPDVLSDKSGETFVLMKGRLWHVESWMTGHCDRGPFHPNKIEAACQALAKLHLAWPKTGSGSCPAIHRRVQALADWNDFVGSQKGSFPTQTALPADLVSAARDALEKGLRELPELLGSWKKEEWNLQYCLCDIWRPHVLFVGDRVSGIVDYGSVKVDHVAADLGRLLGSWVAGEQHLWDAGLDAYAAVKPLCARERILAAVLNRSGTILSLATWLLWLCRDQRTFDDASKATERLEWLVEQASPARRPFPRS
jgi:Ser/Thr protein kinase RdoA (MazF antagonist)